MKSKTLLVNHQRTNPVTVDNEWAQRIILGRSYVLAAYIEFLHGVVVVTRGRRRRKQMMVIGARRDTLIVLRSQFCLVLNLATEWT